MPPALVVKTVVPGAFPGVIEKGQVLLAIWRIHITVMVALLYVTAIQLERCLVANIACQLNVQILVEGDAASLGAVRSEIIHCDTGRDTGIATFAVRSVQVVPAAAKAQHRKVAVQNLVNLLAGVNKQGGRFPVLKVAAAMGVGRVDLQVPQ